MSDSNERVNHPQHYQRLKAKLGVEAVDICEEYGFVRGNALKYLLRAGAKGEEGMTDAAKAVEDLRKAVWYIEREIAELMYGKRS